MKTIEIETAQTQLPDLVRSLRHGERIVICEKGEARAWLVSPDATAPAIRELTPDPSLRPEYAAGYDPTEPTTEDEWPEDAR